ncbi:MAG: adenine-specific DNA methylase [Candidatus Paceibacterota bacterium]
MIKFSREWSMPNSNTFSVKPIHDLIKRYIVREKPKVIIDPFARNSPFKKLCIATNDLSLDFDTTHHLEALEFLKLFEDESADMVLFDPPWTVRQISECYRSVGRKVHQTDTQSSFYGERKKEIARILKCDGIVICCGYNSGGIGKTLGMELLEILMVPHGGAHYDSIVTVERKVYTESIMDVI